MAACLVSPALVSLTGLPVEAAGFYPLGSSPHRTPWLQRTRPLRLPTVLVQPAENSHVRSGRSNQRERTLQEAQLFRGPLGLRHPQWVRVMAPGHGIRGGWRFPLGPFVPAHGAVDRRRGTLKLASEDSVGGRGIVGSLCSSVSRGPEQQEACEDGSWSRCPWGGPRG